ncbi:hypothetical protein EWM64_g998 [Hericium alpestre]|uniref:Uncharacterized protein n=1 Tax=Hericium alpestre TaxID=135208 RepID=A0A4Z0A8C6_9AGAM|nr:hypothetical protein EWM64_g998 [Hericium alpestre]
MLTRNSKDRPASPTFDESEPASEELSEADPALQHALDKARGQIEDMIATIATKHGKSYEEVAQHFFVDDEDVDDEDIDDEDIDDEDIDGEDKAEVGYVVLPDEQKQTLLEILLQRLDARGTAVSHRTTSKRKDDERRIPVHDVRMALNKLLNEERHTGLVSKKNDLKNMIQSMLHDQLYASTGDESVRLECSGWDDEMTRAQGIIIECDWSPV